MAEFMNVNGRKNYKDRKFCNDEVEYKKLYRFTPEHVIWMADHFLGEYTETMKPWVQHSLMSKKWKLPFKLEPYMDEIFIKRSFESMGESVVSVKIIRNKATGQTLGYCFVEFPDALCARNSMLKLNGKPIPGTSPSRRFKLNHASFGKEHLNVQECSLFVGELSEDVDDLALYNCFRRYPSCRSAKVVLDNGKSRGYGFVRFTDEGDQKRAMIEMQNYCSLGWKPIRVSMATPKRPGMPDTVPDSELAYTGASRSYFFDAPDGESPSPSPPQHAGTPNIPDPLSAAVAAAVTGSSSAQDDYYKAYQQYYQQYYNQQYYTSIPPPPIYPPASYTPSQPPPMDSSCYYGAPPPPLPTDPVGGYHHQETSAAGSGGPSVSGGQLLANPPDGPKADVQDTTVATDIHNGPIDGMTSYEEYDVFDFLEESRWTFMDKDLPTIIKHCI